MCVFIYACSSMSSNFSVLCRPSLCGAIGAIVFLSDFTPIPTPKKHMYTTNHIPTSEEYPHIPKELQEGSQPYSDLDHISLLVEQKNVK